MTKRRTKGDGSVYQRKDGRFVGEYTDVLGKRRYVSGKNKTEVKAKLKTKLKEKVEGIVPANTTFGTYLDQWLESTKGTVGLRTYQRAEETVRLHIKPKLGRVRLDTVTALQLDTLYQAKAKKLSPRSVQIIHATAHKALKQAARWRMVRDNVAEHATPPRAVQKATAVLTKVQAQILLRTAKKNQPKLYALWALSVSTGARLGELLGLQPEDVCLESGTLRIARSVHNSRVSQPKTRAGTRTIVGPRSSRWSQQGEEDRLRAFLVPLWPCLPSPCSLASSYNESNQYTFVVQLHIKVYIPWPICVLYYMWTLVRRFVGEGCLHRPFFLQYCGYAFC